METRNILIALCLGAATVVSAQTRNTKALAHTLPVTAQDNEQTIIAKAVRVVPT